MRLCAKCKNTLIDVEKSWCNPCRKIYLQQYRKNNKERLAELTKKWCENNAESLKNKKYLYCATPKGRCCELAKSASRRAKKRQMVCELNTSILLELWIKQSGACALTKIKFFLPESHQSGKRHPFSPSVDRIDGEKGYTYENVRLVCQMVNCGINEFGESAFREMCLDFVKFQGDKL